MVRRSWCGITGMLALSMALLALTACGTASAAHMTPTVVPVATPLLPAQCLAQQTDVCIATLTLLDRAGQTRLPNNLTYQPQPASKFSFGPPSAGNALFITGNDINILVTLVNPTNTLETVDNVLLRLVGFTPFNGAIANAFAACDMRAYSAKGVQPLGTCNLGDDPPATYGYPVELATTVTPGAVIPLQLAVTPEGRQSTGPVTIAPFQTSGGSTTMLDIDIAPHVAGTYTFQVGMLIHDGEPRYFTPTLAALAVTPANIQTFWSADNCRAFANQGQIPATGAYLCPGPVPG
jgi:hypothetical protein